MPQRRPVEDFPAPRWNPIEYLRDHPVPPAYFDTDDDLLEHIDDQNQVRAMNELRDQITLAGTTFTPADYATWEFAKSYYWAEVDEIYTVFVHDEEFYNLLDWD